MKHSKQIISEALRLNYRKYGKELNPKDLLDNEGNLISESM